MSQLYEVKIADPKLSEWSDFMRATDIAALMQMLITVPSFYDLLMRATSIQITEQAQGPAT